MIQRPCSYSIISEPEPFAKLFPGDHQREGQQKGAESLDVPGRALAILPGKPVVKIQAPWVSEDQLKALLVGSGPAQALPEAVQAGDVAQAELKRRVIQLSEKGMSQREIEQELFGYTGGTAHRKVSVILEGATTTDSESVSGAVA